MSGRATTTMYWSSETISMAKDRSARVAVDRFQPRLCGVDGDSRIRKTISPRVRYALGSDCALGERRVELVHREDGIDLRVSARGASRTGYRLVGGIGEYEPVWRMAYVRGPEGIIVSLAERIG